MKKSLLSILISGMAVAAMAQTGVPTEHAPIPFNPGNLPVGKFQVAPRTPVDRSAPGLNKAGNPPYYQYNYAQGIVDWNQDQSSIYSFASTMFPDSFINMASKSYDGTFDTLSSYYGYAQEKQNGVGIYSHGIGFVLDPRSPMYEAAPTGVEYAKLGYYNTYRVDSVQMRYFYERFSDDDVVDTLILQFYKISTATANNPNKNRLWPNSGAGSYNPDTVDFAFAPYNYQSNVINGAVETKVILLGPGDTITNGIRNLSIAVNQLMAPRQQSAVFASYRPGTNYSKVAPFDTANAATFDGNPISKRINTFYYVINFDQSRYFENNAGLPITEKIYQNGMFIPPFIRYNNNAGNWSGMPLPGQAIYTQTGSTPANRTPIFPDFTFHVSDVNVGVHEINMEGYGLGNAYPNPANVNGTVSIDFKLAKSEVVSMNVTNILGQSVRTAVSNETMAAGTHTVSVDLNGLESGVYFYTIKAGNYAQTKKFTISK